MRDCIVVEFTGERAERRADLRGAANAGLQRLVVGAAEDSFLEELPEPAAEQVMRSVIWVMILPFSAAPAPENTMTPTRERLADVP